jgi:hypothetical protein
MLPFYERAYITLGLDRRSFVRWNRGGRIRRGRYRSGWFRRGRYRSRRLRRGRFRGRRLRRRRYRSGWL